MRRGNIIENVRKWKLILNGWIVNYCFCFYWSMKLFMIFGMGNSSIIMFRGNYIWLTLAEFIKYGYICQWSRNDKIIARRCYKMRDGYIVHVSYKFNKFAHSIVVFFFLNCTQITASNYKLNLCFCNYFV